MSHNRWEFIKANLHFNNNDHMPHREDPGRDRLFKIRPLVDNLTKTFNALHLTQQMICIDEQIVPFKGRSSLKQYNPKKPHKWGYKLFVLCDSTGIVHNFQVYTGSISSVNGLPDIGSSGNIVLKLVENVPRNQGFLLFFDNWYSSLRLFCVLSDMGIEALGTIRMNRFPGLQFENDSNMRKKGRGTFEEKGTIVDGKEIRALKWIDNRGVVLASTFESAHPVSEVNRFDRKTKTDISVPCPKAVKSYNNFMGGVDLLDGLIAYYRIGIRSKKYYLRFFFHFMDMVLVNGWLLYRKHCECQKINKKDQIDLLEFRTQIAAALCYEGKSNEKKRGRPSTDTVEAEITKKRHRGPTAEMPEFNCRKDKTGHWPVMYEGRQRCKYPGCKGLTAVKCVKCKVHLCFTSQRNCFTEFHV